MRLRQPFVLVVLLLVAAGATVPVDASEDHGLLSDVPRAQFVDNVPLGAVERFAADPVAPSPKVADGNPSEWDAGVETTRLGGQTTVQQGQLVYEDWIGDDSGAARPCVVERRDRNQPVEDLLGWSKYQAIDSALGEEIIPDVDVLGVFEQPQTECEKGVERYGAVGYPSAATPGSADLLEVRVAADATHLHLLVRLHALTPSDEPVVAVAIDRDVDRATGGGGWGLGSGVGTPGAERVFHLTRAGVLRADGQAVAGATVAVDDLGAGSPENPDGFGGVIEASIPRSAIGGTSTRWRLWAGTGVWDADETVWREPDASEPGPRVLNLAFRGGAEPLRTWMEEQQAFELRRAYSLDGIARLSDRFSRTVDLAALSSGADETWQVTPGYYVRWHMTRVTDGQRNGSASGVPEAGPVSARQPYGLYVPKNLAPGFTPMTVWLHWRGPGDHQASYYVPNMARQLAIDRGSVLVSPRGRGSSGWYVGDSQIDVLDAIADAEAFLGTAPEQRAIGGYSMGGWGAYLLSMLYPDRFAAAFVVAGPPVLGLWPYPLEPVEPQNGRPLYSTNPLVANARNVPTVIFHGTNDELVPVSGVLQQARTYLNNRQPHRLYLFAGYEHFSFALADEWSRASEYLGRRSAVSAPPRVTYVRIPCLDPVRWSPLYTEVADAAYYVSDITLADEPSGDCTSRATPPGELGKRGSVDLTVAAGFPGSHVEEPEAGAGGPPDHTGAYAMTGYRNEPRDVSFVEDRFDVVARNLASFRIDAPRAGLDGPPLLGNVDTDARVTIHLDGIDGGELLVDGESQGAFTGSVTVPPGIHFVLIRR